jgi:hypothetical protein
MNALTTTVATRLPMPADTALSPSQWRVLCEAIFPAAKSPESITLAIHYCQARGYDVMKGQLGAQLAGDLPHPIQLALDRSRALLQLDPIMIASNRAMIARSRRPGPPR